MDINDLFDEVERLGIEYYENYFGEEEDDIPMRFHYNGFLSFRMAMNGNSFMPLSDEDLLD